MEEKLQINVRDIISGLQMNFEEIHKKVSENDCVCELKEEIDGFFDFVDSSIVATFYFDNGGNAIKRLLVKAEEQNSSTRVMAMDFPYAVNQYMEYLDGMKKYIDESKGKDLDSPEVNDSFNAILMKDLDFIRSIFDRDFEKTNNPEVSKSLSEALNCVNVLLRIKDIVASFKNESCVDSIFDKLNFLSKIRFAYYSTCGVLEQLVFIVNQVNGVVETPVSNNPVYAVF